MKVLNICILAFFAVAVSATFEGTWTDDGYGENFSYCCIRGSRLHCTYAEIGIIDGTINGNTVTGEWYEGGGDIVPCSYGTFTWTLASDGESFSGSYECQDSGSGSWDGDRVSSATPEPEQCLVRSSSRDISGQTSDGSFTLCNGAGEYEQSYFETATKPGYEFGVTFDGSSIGSGYYYGQDLETGLYYFGVSLLFVGENGEAVNLYRRGEELYEHPAPFDLATEDNDAHGVVIDDTWVAGNPSESLCAENSDLRRNVEDIFLSSSSGSSGSSGSSSSRSSFSSSTRTFSSSDASTLAIGGVLIVAGVIATLF